MADNIGQTNNGENMSDQRPQTVVAFPKTINGTITVEIPIELLEEEGCYLHLDVGWHLKGAEPTHVKLTEDEIYRAMLFARRQERAASARVRNLRMFLAELCKQQGEE